MLFSPLPPALGVLPSATACSRHSRPSHATGTTVTHCPKPRSYAAARPPEPAEPETPAARNLSEEPHPSGGSEPAPRRNRGGQLKAAPTEPLEGQPLKRLLALMERDCVIRKNGTLSISRDRSDPQLPWLWKLPQQLGGGTLRQDKNAEVYLLRPINLRRRVLEALRRSPLDTPKLRTIGRRLAHSLGESPLLPTTFPLPRGPLGELGDYGPLPTPRTLRLPRSGRRRRRPGDLGSASRLRGVWRQRVLALLERPRGFYLNRVPKCGTRLRLALYADE